MSDRDYIQQGVTAWGYKDGNKIKGVTELVPPIEAYKQVQQTQELIQ